MKANVKTVTVRLISCPECEDGVVGHLNLILDDKARKFPYKVEQWHCDECGAGFSVTINDAENIELKSVSERRLPLLNLMRFAGNKDPNSPDHLFMVMRSTRLVDTSKPIDITELAEQEKYYYEEHTCPANWISPDTIYRNDADYHGIFEVMKTVLEPTQEQWEQLTKEFHGYSLEKDVKKGMKEINDMPAAMIFKMFDMLHVHEHIQQILDKQSDGYSLYLSEPPVFASLAPEPPKEPE